jgi:hypothetical protein
LAAEATALLARQAASLTKQTTLGFVDTQSGEFFEMRAAPQQ